MVISKNSIQHGQPQINQEVIGKAETATYLRSIVNEYRDHSIEIRCRIEKVRSTFLKFPICLDAILTLLQQRQQASSKD